MILQLTMNGWHVIHQRKAEHRNCKEHSMNMFFKPQHPKIQNCAGETSPGHFHDGSTQPFRYGPARCDSALGRRHQGSVLAIGGDHIFTMPPFGPDLVSSSRNCLVTQPKPPHSRPRCNVPGPTMASCRQNESHTQPGNARGKLEPRQHLAGPVSGWPNGGA